MIIISSDCNIFKRVYGGNKRRCYNDIGRNGNKKKAIV